MINDGDRPPSPVATVWITKYALTTGIIKVEARISQGSDMVIYRIADYDEFAYRNGRDFHFDRGLAIARAEEMRMDKITSHHKSIQRLESLSFDSTL